MLQAQKVRCDARKKNRVCIGCGIRAQFWGVRCIICRERIVKDPQACPMEPDGHCGFIAKPNARCSLSKGKLKQDLPFANYWQAETSRVIARSPYDFTPD
jgi:hypothetical protein